MIVLWILLQKSSTVHLARMASSTSLAPQKKKQCGKVLLSVGQDNRLLIVGKLALGLCVDSDLEILSAVIEII